MKVKTKVVLQVIGALVGRTLEKLEEQESWKSGYISFNNDVSVRKCIIIKVAEILHCTLKHPGNELEARNKLFIKRFIKKKKQNVRLS